MREWNKVIYQDCMNDKNGLPTLEDKSVDLCITDPPWGYFDIKKRKTTRILTNTKTKRKLKGQNQVVYYNDDFRPEWYLSWFKELERICNGIIIIMGQSQFIWWIQNTNPRGIFILTLTNSISSSKISKYNKYSPYLFYGDFFRTHKLMYNVLEYTIPWGFLSKDKWIHPSPKGKKILKHLLNQSIDIYSQNSEGYNP